MDPQKAQVSAPRLISDFEVLYNTLVADPVVPAGFLTEFTELEEHARRAATRTLNKYVSITEAAASMDLERHRGQQVSKDAEDRALFDQIVLQVELRPPRFRTEWQKLAGDGQTSRRDAEADLRNRYLRILSDMFKNTNNSMGQLLQENHQDLELLGAGRRAKHIAIPGSRRPEVFGIVGSSQEYLQVRLAEPCVRGALEHTHTLSCYIFLQEVAGLSIKPTDEALHVVTRKEIMVSALPSRPPRQAPRYPTVLLAALEDLIKDTETRVYWKVLAWWLLVQGTLRFDDRWGILSADVVVDDSGMHAKLTRSMVSGPDKKYHAGENDYRYRSEIKSKTIGLYQITDVTDLYKIENNKSAKKLQTLQTLQTLQFLIKKKCAVWSWVHIFKHSR